MILLLSVIGYSFFWGLRKGSTYCIALCAPSLFPTISHKEGKEEGFLVGLKFNLPRISLLTLFGAVVGFVIYKGVNLSHVSESGASLFRYGYLIIGFFLVAFGLYNLAHSLEEKEDIKEGICHPLFKITKDKKFPLLWGCAFSLVCVGEASIAFETFLLAGSISIFFSSPVSAVYMGSLVMLFFGIGLSSPMLLYTTLGAGYTAEKGRTLLNRIRLITSILMVILGLIAVISYL